MEKQNMVGKDLVRGEHYNWVHQPERLVYLGKSRSWYQFALIEKPHEVWCEVLEEDIQSFEKTVV